MHIHCDNGWKNAPHACETVHHHIICRHQIEIEILPASAAEVYFADERYADPVNTQHRFQAIVYNAPSSGVEWQVSDINGGPGAGNIDTTGLYTAPPKGALAHGHTDIVIANATDDPTRRAYAMITLVGHGPEPPLQPELAIYPEVARLYYQSGAHNAYIDVSNKMQQFRIAFRHTPLSNVIWSGGISDGLYITPASGASHATITVQAHLAADSSVKAEAKVILLNYIWSGIVQ